MQPFSENTAEILLLAFLSITFLQSSSDKVLDWRGNLEWLTPHFAKTPFKRMVPVLLGVLLLTESAAGILCALGILETLMGFSAGFSNSGAVVACVALLMLLLGQRIAKDYDGARTIVIYFIPAIILVILHQA
jgi:uncharacterized membrane protein YphA (DoxX/SURF4 family)